MNQSGLDRRSFLKRVGVTLSLVVGASSLTLAAFCVTTKRAPREVRAKAELLKEFQG